MKGRLAAVEKRQAQKWEVERRDGQCELQIEGADERGRMEVTRRKQQQEPLLEQPTMLVW